MLVLSLALYAPTLRNGFVTDDNLQILQNSIVLQGKDLSQAFTGEVWSFSHSNLKDDARYGTNYYRPFQLLLYAAEYHFWGPHPFYWHLVDLILNAAVVGLVYLVVAYLGAPLLAFWAALCFAIHPIHSEPVAWIAALPELLCAFFLLMAMLFYRRADQASSSLRPLLLSVFFFLCALLSKEPAILLPVILLAYEFLYHHPRLADFRKLAARLSPFLIVLTGYLVARISALGGFSPRQNMDRPRLSISELFFAIPAVFTRYIGKLFLPIHLNYFHAFPLTTTFTLRALGGFVAGLLLAAAIFYFYRTSRPLLGFAICWFLLTLAPALSLNSLALNFFTERYLYIPSFGFAIVVAAAGIAVYSGLQSPSLRMAFGAVVAVIFLFSIIQTERRVALFFDNYTLLSDTVRKSPNSFVAQGQYAAALYDRHDVDGALEHALRAIQLNPDYVLGHLNAAWYLAEKEQYDSAVEHLKEVNRLVPDYDLGYVNLAKVYTLQHNWELAADTYRHLASLDPGQAAYFLQLASLAEVNERAQTASSQQANETYPQDLPSLVRLGDESAQARQWPRAAGAFQRASALLPSNATVLYKWGFSLLGAGEATRAVDVLQRAVALQPDSLLFRQTLANALSGAGRLDESNAQLRKILAAHSNWEHADQTHFALGANLEKSGDPSGAIQEYQRALALNPSQQLAAQRLAALGPR